MYENRRNTQIIITYCFWYDVLFTSSSSRLHKVSYDVRYLTSNCKEKLKITRCEVTCAELGSVPKTISAKYN